MKRRLRTLELHLPRPTKISANSECTQNQQRGNILPHTNMIHSLVNYGRYKICFTEMSVPVQTQQSQVVNNLHRR
jgi:hypothetical protein